MLLASPQAWLASLNFNPVVGEAILAHLRKALGSEANARAEMIFMGKLGELGSHDVIRAMLGEMPILDQIAHILWGGVSDLSAELQSMQHDEEEEGEEEDDHHERKRREMHAKSRGAALGFSSDEGERAEASGTEASSLFGGAASNGGSKFAEKLAADKEKQDAWELETKRQEKQRHVEKKLQERVEELGRPLGEEEEAELRVELDREFEAKFAAAKLDAAAKEKVAELEQQLGRPLSEEERANVRAELEAEAKKAEEELSRLRKVKEQESVEALHQKMVTDGGFNLQFGPPAMFFRGITPIVGRGNVDIRAGIEEEHTMRGDADVPFTSPNYFIQTTSRVEHAFVVYPEGGPEQLNLTVWPPAPHRGNRTARPMSDFQEPWDRVNAKLRGLGEETLSDANFIGLRLYTGPMYIKYNTLLRARSGVVSVLNKTADVWCMDNNYPSTIFAITQGIVTLGKIMMADRLYRAPGGVLPQCFWEKDEFGVLGGIEPAFMSATTSKEEAMNYARRSKARVILEVQNAARPLALPTLPHPSPSQQPRAAARRRSRCAASIGLAAAAGDGLPKTNLNPNPNLNLAGAAGDGLARRVHFVALAGASPLQLVTADISMALAGLCNRQSL